ncbi:MAG: methionyl aminopeptidase [Chlamydiae bacterium]|nr:methionyl aminopeptidase [Chlamydiota bacterium]
MISRNDPCWCGSGKKYKHCHHPQENPLTTNVNLALQYKKQYGILLKTPAQIEGIRNACKLAAYILNEACQLVKQGVTTNQINDLIVKLHKEHNAIPAPLGYGDPPFPKACCTSLNEVICHGIPNDTPLKNGDFLNIDVTSILNGYYGDCSAMVAIGTIDPEKKLVMETAYECLMRSIHILKPGILIHEIGDVIEDYAASHKCSVVNQFVGHGVGINFHEAPQIPHHTNNLKIPFVEGMTFTIEPMINAGKRGAQIDPIDKWTARTVDGRASAQWEHTILITKDGHEILTLL